MSLLDYGDSSGIWKLDGKCASLTEYKYPAADGIFDSFFAETESGRAKAIEYCQDGCPIRLKCLKNAMEVGELYGVWGGVDESERRRDLWVSPTGKVGMRKSRPRCPDCKGKLSAVGIKSTCSSCGFSWKSETTVEGLQAFPLEVSGV